MANYDWMLHEFVSHQENMYRSQARVWQSFLLAWFISMAVVLGTWQDLFARIFGPEAQEFKLLLGWLVAVVAFGALFYSLASVLYWSKLADWIPSQFKPRQDELRGPTDHGGRYRTTTRQRLYNSVDSIRAKMVLKQILEKRRTSPPTNRSWAQLLERIAWISVAIKPDEGEPTSASGLRRFEFRARWDTLVVRSAACAFFCASIIGIGWAHIVHICWWAHFFVIVAAVSYVAYWRLFEREMSRRNELANELENELGRPRGREPP